MTPRPDSHFPPQSHTGPDTRQVAPPQRYLSGPDGNGVFRGEVFLLRASAARRWWARIFDGFFVLVLAAAVFALGGVLGEKGLVSVDVRTIVLVAAYPVSLLVFGVLYGCTRSPGQAITGVVSLRSFSGRRVGFWRGLGRYLAVGFFPLALCGVILAALESAPTLYEEPVRVYRR